MSNVILLLSGGLDSGVLAYYIKHKLNPGNYKVLFIDYNQRTLKQELKAAKDIAKDINAEFIKTDLKFLDKISTSLINSNKPTTISDPSSMEQESKDVLNWWVPCRNSLFILTALAYAESEYIKNKVRYDIYIGLKCEGKVPMKDTTPKFIEQINKLAEEATHHGGYTIKAPFIDLDKDEIIKIGSAINVPFKKTFSCYVSKNEKHCGVCSNCQQRKQAFYWAGIKDTTDYSKSKL